MGMAKVLLKQKRELEAGYHVYTLPTPSGDLVTVRRKVGMPTDVEHSSSTATRRQRDRFGAASKRWSAIQSPIRAQMSSNYGWTYSQTPHGKSEPKLLQGRQLFISQDIHQQEYHQQHAEIPFHCCIILCAEDDTPLAGQLTLSGKYQEQTTPIPSKRLSPANFLFHPFPPIDFEFYLPYGIAPGYHDPGIPPLTKTELPSYHYHHMLPGEQPILPCPEGANCVNISDTDFFTRINAYAHYIPDTRHFGIRQYLCLQDCYLFRLTPTFISISPTLTGLFALFNNCQFPPLSVYPPPDLPQHDYTALPGCYWYTYYTCIPVHGACLAFRIPLIPCSAGDTICLVTDIRA